MTDSGRKVFNVVIAFLVSIAAWVFVVYNYEPMTLVKYVDVPVDFTGERELADRGLAVNEASLEEVTVTLSQKRVDGASISAEDISVVADVSECVAGANTVMLDVSGPSGTKVSSVSAEATDIDVSRIKSETLDIDVRYSGDTEEDEEPIAYDLSSTEAYVSCSNEVYDKIHEVAALLDREDLSDTPKSFTLDLVALDKEGNVIPHVVITPKEISLDASAGYTKTVKLYMKVKDDSDDNYERKYTAPETVTIKGPKDVVNKVAGVYSKEIDVSYRYSDEEIELEYDLPDGVYIADGSIGQIMKLTVTQKEDEE